MRKIITSVLLGLAMILGSTGAAHAGPVKPKSAKSKSVIRASVKSICATGYRGQKLYDAKCLRTGTVMDGVNLWFKIDGKNVSTADRRAFCRDATSTGHTRAAIIDGLNDVAYDSFRNHAYVLSIAGTVGTWDCQALGIKIKK